MWALYQILQIQIIDKDKHKHKSQNMGATWRYNEVKWLKRKKGYLYGPQKSNNEVYYLLFKVAYEHESFPFKKFLQSNPAILKKKVLRQKAKIIEKE